jgi:hypothetical protein
MKAVKADAHATWNGKSVMTNTTHVIARARARRPPIVSASETTSIRSLSRRRQRRRWYELGAINSTLETAVAMKAAKKTSRSAGAELRETVAEGNDEQEREQHLHAGQRDAQLVEELDQLPVVTFLLALGHRSLYSSQESRLKPPISWMAP